jgi:hypothetical protein
MATATLLQPSGDGNPVNKVALANVVFAATGKIIEKELRRDEIADGSSHKVELMLVARIDGQHRFMQQYVADVSVGHSAERACGQNPNVAKVLAYALSKLNAATREAIIRELPQDFADNGAEFPAVDAAIEAAADGMLKKMRAAMPKTTVRGSVSVKHEQPRQPLNLFIGD